MGVSEKDVVQALLQKAARARVDPEEFIEFCGRDEHTGAWVGCAAHIRLAMRFVQAHAPVCCLVWPVGFGKTWSQVHFATWMIGNDLATRGAIISATQEQAKKPFILCRDLIETNPRVKLVFPHLGRTRRTGEPWSDHEIVVERPPGIRDRTMVAWGIDGPILGARLSWILCDDLLTHENTNTPDQRQNVWMKLQGPVVSRLDPANRKVRDQSGKMITAPPGRMVVTNTAWHHDDAVQRLIKNGTPTLRMEATGDIFLVNTTWDTDLVRPKFSGGRTCALDCYGCDSCAVRLVANDPDAKNEKTLWPDRYSAKDLADIRDKTPPILWNANFLGLCRDESSAWCKSEWIDACFQNGRGLELLDPQVIGVNGWLAHCERTGEEPGLVFTGCDPAFRADERADWSVITSFAIRKDGTRRMIWMDRFQAGVDTLLKVLIRHWQAFDPGAVCVENNAAQEAIVTMLHAYDKSIPVKGVTTGKGKMDTTYGIPSFFPELALKAWVLPCDRFGRRPAQLLPFVHEALNFAPDKHTGDTLMSIQVARVIAKEWGFGLGNAFQEGPGNGIARILKVR